MALAIYTHVTAAFVVVAHALIALVIWWRQGRSLTTPVRRALAAIILTGTFSLQLYALVLPQFFDTLLTPTMAGTDTAWKDPLWLLTETLGGLARGLPGGWIALVGGLVVAGAGLWSYARQSLTWYRSSFSLGSLRCLRCWRCRITSGRGFSSSAPASR
jgi:hypothetical protein